MGIYLYNVRDAETHKIVATSSNKEQLVELCEKANFDYLYEHETAETPFYVDDGDYEM